MIWGIRLEILGYLDARIRSKKKKVLQLIKCEKKWERIMKEE
jgi:hypothetical protein